MFKFKRGKENRWGLLFDIATALLLLVLCCFLFAVLSAFSKDPTARLVPYSLAALAVSAAISGLRAGTRRREGVGSLPILTAGIIMLIILAAGLIGGASFSLGLILNALSYGGIFIAAAFLTERKKKGHKRRTAR